MGRQHGGGGSSEAERLAGAVFHDAYELAGRPRRGAVLFTGEHASNRVPAPWTVRPADRALLQTHWGYDIGVADLGRALAHLGDTGAVLARFSRLICDCNRAPDDPTLALPHTDDGVPSFNTRVDLASRLARFHAPYHDTIDRVIRAATPRLLVSLHSFTPVFRGVARPMEAGVLFDRHDALALRLVDTLRAEGLRTEPNAPYSGKDGLIYSAARHGGVHGLRYLEIEVRQDLISTRPAAEAMAERIHRAILAIGD